MERMGPRLPPFAGNPPVTPGLAPGDDLPPEYWSALLEDARAYGGRLKKGLWGRLQPLSQISEHLLRVGCRRCSRTVEI